MKAHLPEREALMADLVSLPGMSLREYQIEVEEYLTLYDHGIPIRHKGGMATLEIIISITEKKIHHKY